MSIQESPSYRKNLGKVSSTYRDGGTQGQYMNACRIAAWQRVIDKHQISTERVLDIGCSSGSWAENWRTMGFKELHGIEPNPDVAQEAASKFDHVEHGFLEEVVDRMSTYQTIAANGVIVHILEEPATEKFLTDAARLLTPDGHLIFSVINCAYYATAGGRAPFDGPNSCTRPLHYHRNVAASAGLEIVDEVGTFINPWCVDELDFVAGHDVIKAAPELWHGWELIAQAHRGNSLIPFAEVLMVTRLAGQ